MCQRERGNFRDHYAVAVIKDDVVVGHLPRKISRVSSLFIRRGGTIRCRVLGRRRYSSDLPQGGLEILVHVYCCLKTPRNKLTSCLYS